MALPSIDSHARDAYGAAMPKRIVSGGSAQVTLRIDPSLLRRADAIAERRQSANGGRVFRSDILREAVSRGLPLLRKELASA